MIHGVFNFLLPTNCGAQARILTNLRNQSTTRSFGSNLPLIVTCIIMLPMLPLLLLLILVLDIYFLKKNVCFFSHKQNVGKEVCGLNLIHILDLQSNENFFTYTRETLQNKWRKYAQNMWVCLKRTKFILNSSANS